MQHIAVKLRFRRGATIELTYSDGEKRRYDMSQLFDAYPQMWDLTNRRFFKSGILDPFGYWVIWDGDIDISSDEVYNNGEIVK